MNLSGKLNNPTFLVTDNEQRNSLKRNLPARMKKMSFKKAGKYLGKSIIVESDSCNSSSSLCCSPLDNSPTPQPQPPPLPETIIIASSSPNHAQVHVLPNPIQLKLAQSAPETIDRTDALITVAGVKIYTVSQLINLATSSIEDFKKSIFNSVYANNNGLAYCVLDSVAPKCFILSEFDAELNLVTSTNAALVRIIPNAALKFKTLRMFLPRRLMLTKQLMQLQEYQLLTFHW